MENEDQITNGQKARVTRVINEFKEQADELIEQISNFREELLVDSEQRKSIKTQINEINDDSQKQLTSINEKYNRIQELYLELIEGDENSESIETEIKKNSY